MQIRSKRGTTNRSLIERLHKTPQVDVVGSRHMHAAGAFSTQTFGDKGENYSAQSASSKVWQLFE